MANLRSQREEKTMRRADGASPASRLLLPSRLPQIQRGQRPVRHPTHPVSRQLLGIRYGALAARKFEPTLDAQIVSRQDENGKPAVIPQIRM